MSRMKVIDKLAWLELRNGKILSTRSKGRTKYYIPGGKREVGESDFEALSREIREELSVELIEGSTKFMGVFQAQADSHPDGVQVRMTCYTGSCNGAVMPSCEIDEVVWLNYKDIESVSPVDQIIFEWLKERNLLS